jgi:hypothetical protein
LQSGIQGRVEEWVDGRLPNASEVEAQMLADPSLKSDVHLPRFTGAAHTLTERVRTTASTTGDMMPLPVHSLPSEVNSKVVPRKTKVVNLYKREAVVLGSHPSA